ncbi:MAG: NADP-dependent isocitrate dehydrogenase [Leptospiraceae bacterium]|nr:NADP-dependent isocitrate dehydrogenase [Leptospiraceae bacterium]MDW8307029.1 NADP-dependent isocitrate dehydrogenase [Leptospiraceae bacterium]
MEQAKIIYTKTDEAPLLATYSFLPIVRAFCGTAGIDVELRDISLAGRILAAFPEYLKESQRVNDDLAYLGELTLKPKANIIKLPNISASLPQLKAAIKELQEQGYALPDYPEEPKSEEEKKIRERYGKVLGSAVNPVIREGNSDRRAPLSVKNYARKNPHKMGEWRSDSKTHVAHMSHGDFYGSEKSRTLDKDVELTYKLFSSGGEEIVLKQGVKAKAGDIVDGAVMSISVLRDFYEKEMEDARKQDILFSLHLKATMMKVSDPILFGHAVEIYFKDLFSKYSQELEQIKADPRQGLGDLYEKLKSLPQEKQQLIKKEIEDIYTRRPRLAMVNSEKGITNLHYPNDVIIDASMPAMIREGGKMWGPDGKLADCKATIPDRSYARVYAVVIEDCKARGAFDPRTMGSVANVGLMAQKAEEYGSHDKTFEIPFDGIVRVFTQEGDLLFEHEVHKGDIYRSCLTTDAAIRDWVKLAIKRGRATGTPCIFWLDPDRAHDRELINKVQKYLLEAEAHSLDIRILSPQDACKLTLERLRQGLDTISVTGNVLRDYLTDLFPILELGTSAKMLSIVPLMNGGGLYETGAGGSAPKHVQQFLEEGYLRWDSLGEFLALAVSLEQVASDYNNPKALILAKCLDRATQKVLENNKSPARKVGEIDNRGSHFYLALYWAQELASQKEDMELASKFKRLFDYLSQNEQKINQELIAAQGRAQHLGGYYHPKEELVDQAMRPSSTLNNAWQILYN